MVCCGTVEEEVADEVLEAVVDAAVKRIFAEQPLCPFRVSKVVVVEIIGAIVEAPRLERISVNDDFR